MTLPCTSVSRMSSSRPLLVEVGEQCRDRLIDLPAHRLVPLLQLAVLVPGIGAVAAADGVGPAGKLHEPHAPFHEPTSEQALPAVGRLLWVPLVEAVELFRRLGLVRDDGERGHGGPGVDRS